MLPALQPSRPKYPPQPHAKPSHQYQQARTLQQHISTHQAGSVERSQALTGPGSQFEAMPPFAAPALPHRSAGAGPQLYDSAVRHPVFFTNQLRKPPFPLPENAASGINPVAFGYVQEHRRPDAGMGGQTKL